MKVLVDYRLNEDDRDDIIIYNIEIKSDLPLSVEVQNDYIKFVEDYFESHKEDLIEKFGGIYTFERIVLEPKYTYVYRDRLKHRYLINVLRSS
jgi:hypothetical protein